jgi:uncharacterized protein (DUF2141 family)
MNKYLIFILLIAAGVLIPFKVLGQQFSVTIKITGLQNNTGKVMLSLYNSADGYPQLPAKAFRTVNSVITNNTCTIVLPGIPKGTYAIACFHDENNNGKMDTNVIGIPVEGVGASNNAKGFMGPPKFKDAQFIVEKDTQISVTISH